MNIKKVRDVEEACTKELRKSTQQKKRYKERISQTGFRFMQRTKRGNIIYENEFKIQRFQFKE